MRQVIFFVFFLLSFSAVAENHLLLLGGGGEPEKPTTIFDNDVKLLGNFKRSHPNWKYSINFNGGHARTEELVRTNLEDPATKNRNFTAQNYRDRLKEYERKILDGAIKEGDQLMVMINTHGSAASGLSHKIAVTGGPVQDLINLSGGDVVSVDDVVGLMALAKRKKVKLAIVDLSCHSGNTQKLDDGHACMISSTGPEHYAYAGKDTFSANFLKGMEREKNLEDVYLKARNGKSDFSFPMINTPAGIETHKALYDILSPYMYYADKERTDDKLRQHLLQASDCVECQSGKLPEDKLVEEISRLKNISRESFEKLDAYKDLIKALREYRELQSRALRGIQGKGEILKKSGRFCDKGTPVPNGLVWVSCASYTNEELLLADFPSMIAALSSDPQKNKARIDILRSALAARETLLQANPELASYQDFMAELTPRVTRERAYKVARAARRLYDRIYQMSGNPESSSEKSNPCKDFTL